VPLHHIKEERKQKPVKSLSLRERLGEGIKKFH